MRAIDKLEQHTVVAGTLKQELLKQQYVVLAVNVLRWHEIRNFVNSLTGVCEVCLL